MGQPVIFKQPRPGIIKNGQETIFNLYKFRTMSDARNKNGDLLPDGERLSKFGMILRNTSLDELPNVFCVLKGTMSIIGPRPQLVRDMVFMTDRQRMRHLVKPGLTGLAQVMGRNSIPWEKKLDWDLKYIEKISFLGDVKILFQTAAVVFDRGDIADSENTTALDYGDALLAAGKISKEKYDVLQTRAKKILELYK